MLFINLVKPSYIKSTRIFFVMILILSFIVRWGLVARGGQLFNPDEYRYLTSRVIAREIQKGHYSDAIKEATRKADHLGFKIAGILPALIEVKHDRDINSKTAVVPALFFSLFSWMNIAIVWFLALRLGANESEALWATVLLATSNTFFYYSSHLYPYDLSMTFGLLTLYIGFQSESGDWRSILTGFLGFLTFFIYNGYWTLTAFAFIAHILLPIKHHNRVIVKSVFTIIGFAAPFILLLWVGSLFGNDLWNDYVWFSKTITNGTFSEGTVIPFKYLWATEHIILVIWLLLFSLVVVLLYREHPQRILVWLAGVFFVYGCLSITSVVLHKFVVYGRLVRQLVPFLALIGAYSLSIIGNNKRFGRPVLAAILGIVFIQAGINFHTPLLLTYPAEFIKEVQSRYPDFVPPKNLTYYYSPNVVDVGPYRSYFVKFVIPLPTEASPRQGKVLMSVENPLSAFPPFQYDEWYSSEERSAFPKIEMTITKIE